MFHSMQTIGRLVVAMLAVILVPVTPGCRGWAGRGWGVHTAGRAITESSGKKGWDSVGLRGRQFFVTDPVPSGGHNFSIPLTSGVLLTAKFSMPSENSTVIMGMGNWSQMAGLRIILSQANPETLPSPREYVILANANGIGFMTGFGSEHPRRPELQLVRVLPGRYCMGMSIFWGSMGPTYHSLLVLPVSPERCFDVVEGQVTYIGDFIVWSGKEGVPTKITSEDNFDQRAAEMRRLPCDGVAGLHVTASVVSVGQMAP